MYKFLSFLISVAIIFGLMKITHRIDILKWLCYGPMEKMK